MTYPLRVANAFAKRFFKYSWKLFLFLLRNCYDFILKRKWFGLLQTVIEVDLRRFQQEEGPPFIFKERSAQKVLYRTLNINSKVIDIYIFFTKSMQRQDKKQSNMKLPTIERLSAASKQEFQQALEATNKNSRKADPPGIVKKISKGQAGKNLGDLCSDEEESFIFYDSDESMVTRATENQSGLNGSGSQQLVLGIQSRQIPRKDEGAGSRSDFLKQKVNLADLQKAIAKSK